MSTPKRVTILGSSGSIGTQALDIITQFPDRFTVNGLAVSSNVDCLAHQIREHRPKLVSVKSALDREKLLKCLDGLPHLPEILIGSEGVCTLAAQPDTDFILIAISGTASLGPAYAAIKAGTPIGLASKEVLVSGGEVLMPLIEKNHITMLPVDSEHAAVHQCLAAVDHDISQVKRIILTASGGPFWNTPLADFPKIEVADALKHPNWSMGKKITIDSATMMNKGLEVIEAHYLFNIPYQQIDVLIHPQSIVHAMTEFTDGNTVSHLGAPDMRYPIQYAMLYPEKCDAAWPKLDLTTCPALAFHAPDFQKFPLLKLAYEVGEARGTAPAIMNAANEVAVQLFLEGYIRFTQISEVIREALEIYPNVSVASVEDLIQLDLTIKQDLTAHYHDSFVSL